jgi:hypothetical protein
MHQNGIRQQVLHKLCTFDFASDPNGPTIRKREEKNILGRLLLVGYLLVRKIRVLISIFGIGIALV